MQVQLEYFIIERPISLLKISYKTKIPTEESSAKLIHNISKIQVEKFLLNSSDITLYVV